MENSEGPTEITSRRASLFSFEVSSKGLLLVLRDRLARSRIEDQGLALIIIAVPIEIEHLSDGVCD
jgi:hypothetical protein